MLEPKTLQKPQAAVFTFSVEGAEEKTQNSILTEQRYELRFSVGPEVMTKLEQAKCLLSGKYKAGVKLEQVLDEALEHLLENISLHCALHNQYQAELDYGSNLMNFCRKNKSGAALPG